jgi:hypothetical protein
MLSTVPTMIIFDDHEIVDEWKISDAWVKERQDDARYQRRVAAGLMAYCVNQYLGNLSPDELVRDELYSGIRDRDRDAAPLVGAFAERAASSLPFLLPKGLHHLEATRERVADGAWGRSPARAAERLRRALTLGHWAAFQESFRPLVALLDGVAANAEASVILLAGDVHHGYLARADGPAESMWQIVRSPFRNRLAAYERAAMRLGESRFALGVGALLARAAGVRPTALDWRLCARPSYRNQVAELELDCADGRVRMLVTDPGEWREPRRRTLWERQLAGGTGRHPRAR